VIGHRRLPRGTDVMSREVWSKNHLIKTVARTRSGRVRKVRADALHVKRHVGTIRQHQLALDRGHTPTSGNANGAGARHEFTSEAHAQNRLRTLQAPGGADLDSRLHSPNESVDLGEMERACVAEASCSTSC